MRVYNIYIITVASILLLTAVILLALELNSLGIYYTLYVIEALVVTELFIYFNVKARRGLNQVGAILFAGFVLIMLLHIFRILKILK